MSSPSSSSSNVPWILGSVVVLTVVAAVVLGRAFTGHGSEPPEPPVATTPPPTAVVDASASIDVSVAPTPVAVREVPSLPPIAAPSLPPSTPSTEGMDAGSHEAQMAAMIAEGIEGVHQMRAEMDALHARLLRLGVSRDVADTSVRANMVVVATRRMQQLRGEDFTWSDRIEAYHTARDHLTSPGELPSLRTRMFPESDLPRLGAWEEIEDMLHNNNAPRDS